MSENPAEPRNRRRRTIALAGLTLFVLGLLGLFAVLASHSGHNLDRTHYRLLTPGMAEADVHATLGGPPSRATTGIVLMELIDEEGPAPNAAKGRGKASIWATDRGQIDVEFDGEGRLASKRYFVPAGDWPAKLNGWLGR
jgi:hypothetical protein